MSAAPRALVFAVTGSVVIPLHFQHQLILGGAQLAELAFGAEPQADVLADVPLLIEAEAAADFAVGEVVRSEERRVGKECRL